MKNKIRIIADICIIVYIYVLIYVIHEHSY